MNPPIAPPTIMPTMPLASTEANAGRGTPHSRISAGTAAPSSWLSRPSRMIVSAVATTRQLLVAAPLSFVEQRADVDRLHIDQPSTVSDQSCQSRCFVLRRDRRRLAGLRACVLIEKMTCSDISACSGCAPGVDERPHVLADQAALADVDQLLRGLPLRGLQPVLGRDRIEVRR